MTFVSHYEIGEPRRLGRALREERRKRGLTQAGLADRAGVSRGWLIKFEQGHHSAEADSIFRVIAALGLTMTLTEQIQPPAHDEAQAAFDRVFDD